MCGIAGIVAPNASAYEETIHRMTERLRHRGPDGDAIHVFPSCALGHTRLAVIDLEGGRQPMLSGDATTGVVFNGEIYGYQDIRASHADYPFRTTSDTEVLLALYERHREGLLEHLPGMFSFAVWDEPRRTLLCARDRFGEKPFYYARGAAGELVFASELKAVVASDLLEPVLSTTSLVHYLRHYYVHPHRTIYDNVQALPPAHALLWRDGELRTWRYWELDATDESLELGEAVERFRELLEQAVRRQLVADVPVGAFLSGGLDSSTIVAAARDQGRGLRTFSFGFDTERFDERPYARAAAARYQTDHREITTGDADLVELTCRMPEIYDEPFADSSSMPTYLICAAARRELKVVLTGDGGDELLAGYSRYGRLLEMEGTPGAGLWPPLFKRITQRLLGRFGLGRLADALPPSDGALLRRRYGRLSRANEGLLTFFSDELIERLWLGEPFPPVETNGYDTVDGALRRDLSHYLPGDLLTKTDRASMAHGLELRAPFLDVDLASFCISLPQRLKIRPGTTKLILREAYAESWPPELRRRGKQGFHAPRNDWLRQDPFDALKEEYLRSRNRKIYDLFSYPEIQPLVERNNHRTWSLLILSLWMESHRFLYPS